MNYAKPYCICGCGPSLFHVEHEYPGTFRLCALNRAIALFAEAEYLYISHELTYNAIYNHVLKAKTVLTYETFILDAREYTKTIASKNFASLCEQCGDRLRILKGYNSLPDRRIVIDEAVVWQGNTVANGMLCFLCMMGERRVFYTGIDGGSNHSAKLNGYYTNVPHQTNYGMGLKQFHRLAEQLDIEVIRIGPK